MKAFVVVGMNYGDEGKGHITNYLSDSKTLNIRFNGGAQAAHTVRLSDGRGHIFHHFGSGTLQGARTLLANEFIANPLVFVDELKELLKITEVREVFIDPRCVVTTAYDMMINEFNSSFHGKHNTCGLGINETVERSFFRQLKISARDFFEQDAYPLTAKLKSIKYEYVPYRLEKLGLPWGDFKLKFKDVFSEDKEISAFLNLREIMSRIAVVWPDDSLIDKFLGKEPDRKLVFEGAQGMLLDQNRKAFMPYLTRSNTGVQNVLEILKTVKTGIDLDVYLVSRAYLSRHGDGPVWNAHKKPFSNIENTSNPANGFQGEMRYGFLNKRWYDAALNEAEILLRDPPSCVSSADLGSAMTCIDHVWGDDFKYCDEEGRPPLKGSLEDFKRVKLLSNGPTEKDILKKEKN